MRRSVASKRRILLAAAVATFGVHLPAQANTELDVANGPSDLTLPGSYAQGTAPSTTSDLTFTPGTIYNPATFSINSSLGIGTLDDLDGTQALTIANTGGSDATLRLSGGTDSVLGASPSDLLYVVAGGSLAIQNGPTNALNLALGTTGNFDVVGSASIGSGISGNFGFAKTGSGTLNLSGIDTYTGTTTINAGTVLASQTSGSPFGSGSLLLNSGVLNLTPANVGSPVALAAATAASTTFTYGPGATLLLNSNGNGSMTFTVGSGAGTVFSRATGGTLIISPASGIANLGTTAGESFIVNGTAPATTNGIVSPSIIGRNSTIDSTGTFLTYGAAGTTGFSPFTGYTTESASYTPAANEISDVTASVTVTPGSNPYAMRIGSGDTLTIGGTATTLTVAGGGVILNGGTITGNTLGFGTGEGLIYTNSAGGLISSVVSGSGGLTVFGPGKLTLGASATTTIANTFTGNININGGTLAAVITQLNNVTANSPIGAGGARNITINGGTFELLAGSGLFNPQSGTTSIVVGPGGATLQLDAGGLTLDDANQLVDSTGGTLTKTGTAQLVLGNGTTAFTITGPININAGSLKLLNNGTNALGSATLVTIASGAELDSDGQTVARPLVLNGAGLAAAAHGALTNTSGGLATISGTVNLASNVNIGGTGAGGIKITGIVSGSATLTKIDANTLTLAGANTYTGGTSVTAGTLSLANTTGSAAGPGNVTLNASGGSNLASGTTGLMSGNVIAATSGTNTIIGAGGIYSGGTLATFGTLTVGGLQLTSNATTLAFDLSQPTGSNDELVVTGLDGLTASGVNKVPIVLGQAPTAAGTYHLISFNQDSSGTVGLNSFSFGASGNGRLGYTLEDNAGSGNQQFIDLLVSGDNTPISANFIGTSTPTSWMTAGNWSSNPVVPGLPGDVVTFNNGTSTPGTIVVTLDGQQHVGSLSFNNSGTTAFNIAPGTNATMTPELFLDNTPSGTMAAATLSDTNNSNTISAPIVLVSPTNVTVSGTTDGVPNMLTLSGNLSGTSLLTLSSSSTGTLLLSGANSGFSGGMSIAGGTLRAGSTTALGTATATVVAGATLDQNGQNSSTPLAINGTGVGGAGGLVNTSLTGLTDSGTLNIQSASTIGNIGAMTVSGVVSGTGALTKIGSGNLTFSAATNPFTGAVAINGGTLTLSGGNGAVGTIVAPSITANSGGTLVLSGSDTLGFTAGHNALFINDGSVINNSAGKRNTIINTITMVGGTLGGTSVGDANTGAYSLDTSAAVTATSDASGSPAVISANVSLQTNNTFNVTRGPAVSGSAPDLLVSGPITPYGATSNSLTKTGDGVMTLTGTNTYKGATLVNLGTLNLNNTTSNPVLGNTAITVGNGGTITSSAGNATLLVSGTNSIGTGTGGSLTISGGNGTTIGQGTLSLADGTINTLTLNNTGSSLTIGSATNPGIIDLEVDASGSADQVNAGSSNMLVVNAGGTVNGTAGVGAIINIVPLSGFTNGTYTLISYSGETNTSATGGFAFANGLQTETLNGSTLTLQNGSDFENLTITTNAGGMPGTAYFQGAYDANWSTFDSAGSGNTNFTNDSAGTSNTTQLPGAFTDVHFHATNATTANLATSLGASFTIHTLTLDGGSLSQNVGIASGGNGANTLTITPDDPSSGITVNSGAGALTISAPLIVGAPQTWTNSSTSLMTVSGPISFATLSSGPNALATAGTGNFTISGGISGPGSLTLGGTGTVLLSALNSYTGGTFINSGKLQLGITNALPTTSGLTIGTNPTAGAFDLNGFNQTLASLAIRSNSSTAINTITIEPGSTLTINGTFNIGPSPAADGITTKATFAGGGAFNVNAPTTSLDVGLPNTSQNNPTNTALLDLSALSSFTANVTNFRIGFGQTNAATLDLSNTANNITANLFTVADTQASNGGPGNVLLGTGTNTIAADTINIAISKGTGTVKFASQTANSPGTLTITNRAGTGGANITVGNQNGTGTAAVLLGTLDLRGHVSNISAATVTVGNSNNTAGTGSASGVIDFDTGIFNATTVNLGLKSNTGTGSNTANAINLTGGTFSVSGTTAFAVNTSTAGGNVSAALNVSAGAFSTGSIVGANKNGTGTGGAISTINVSGTGSLIVNSGGTFSLATQANAGTATGTLAITGGSVTSFNDIIDGGGATTTTITLNGGLLDLTGHKIGSAATPIDSLNFQAGTLQNVAEINGGAILTKTTGGTLILNGNNLYAGGTNVNAGTLLASTPMPNQSATGTGAVVVNSGGTLGGGSGTTPGFINASTAITSVTINSFGTITGGTGATASSATGLLKTTGGDPTTATPTYTQSWNAGGTYAWKINSNNATTTALTNGTSDPGGAGANWDMLTMQTVNVPSSGTFNINLVPVSGAGSNPFSGTGNYQWTIADITGTGSNPGIYSGGANVPANNYASLLANNFVLNTSAFTAANPTAAGVFSLGLVSDGSPQGEDLVVNYSNAPEPTSIALFGLAAGGFALRRRRKPRRESMAS